MRVLFVCPWIPWPLNSGGKIRTFHLLRTVADAGVELHVRCVLEPGQSPEVADVLAPFCASVRTFERASPGRMRRWARPKLERWFHSPTLRAAVAAELVQEDYDLIHLEELVVARAVPRWFQGAVVQHHQKIDTVLYETATAHKGPHRHFDLFKLRRLEAYAARRYRDHLMCSGEDAAFLRERYPQLTCGVLPSGYDPEFFRPSTERRDSDLVVFLGSMAYEPNVDAAARFVADIFPKIRAERPGARLAIVGRDPSPEVRALASDVVEVTGEVPDVRPWLARAGCLVVPLRIGGGTRLKIVEALGTTCPVVSTSIGAEGLALIDGEHLAIADDPTTFAERTLTLLGDPEKAARLGRRGEEFVRARYGWDELGRQLAVYWRGVAGAAASERGA